MIVYVVCVCVCVCVCIFMVVFRHILALVHMALSRLERSPVLRSTSLTAPSVFVCIPHFSYLSTHFFALVYVPAHTTASFSLRHLSFRLSAASHKYQRLTVTYLREARACKISANAWTANLSVLSAVSLSAHARARRLWTQIHSLRLTCGLRSAVCDLPVDSDPQRVFYSSVQHLCNLSSAIHQQLNVTTRMATL